LEEGQWIVNFSAENLNGNPAVKTGEDYLKICRRLLEAPGKPYTFTPAEKPIEFGGVAFHEMLVKDDSSPAPIFQRMLCTVKKGHVLFNGITAEDVTSLRELDSSPAKMTFK